MDVVEIDSVPYLRDLELPKAVLIVVTIHVTTNPDFTEWISLT